MTAMAQAGWAAFRMPCSIQEKGQAVACQRHVCMCVYVCVCVCFGGGGGCGGGGGREEGGWRGGGGGDVRPNDDRGSTIDDRQPSTAEPS